MDARTAGRFDRAVVALLAGIAYLPALLSSPGRMPADTKLYLYLDPGRLVSGAPKAWDTSQFGGWVPHQMLSYLWPSGPWFWTGEQFGLPDWVTHRLWIATLLFLGGWGVQRLARVFGLAPAGALVAAFVYQLSPYVLPYVSRTSLMLLPWASLGWLTLLTVHSVRRGGWRYPALLALVVLTVAGANATAFAMVLPGPVLWVITEWHAHRTTTRQVITAGARIASLSIGVSLWWVVMLSIQGRYGADVLAYSETLDAVSLTSTSTEVLRSLGYWLFYIRDPYAPATTAALQYQESGRLIATGFLLLLVCALGLVVVRWGQRRFAVALVVTGVVLAVGVHPFADPAPALSVVRDTGIGLALRSSTRALPLLSLGLGLAVASLVVAVGTRWRRLGYAFMAAIALLAALNFPTLWRAEFVDPALERDQDPPDAWLAAVENLDGSDPDARVLQLPGAEFGAFRWGYTVDQPLPGLTDKPVITRDLLPLGSAQVMDLLYALDNRVQTGTVDTRSIAPVARLLAADRVWLSNDLAFDRFRTPRPEVFADLLHRMVTGLSEPVAYGAPEVNQPDISMVDEQSIADSRVGSPLAPVELLEVTDATSVIRVGDRVVVLDGSGDGVVDASTAGLIIGSEAVLYANDLTADEWASLPADTVFVVTDSNRDRDQQWRGSQDALGMTETGGPSRDGVTTDAGDQRLPVFATDDPEQQTVARLAGGLVVQASTYGEPFAFLPEARAAMAVDGDPSTAWRIGQRWDPIGESLTVEGADTHELVLLQAQGDALRLMITSVDITVGGKVKHVELGEESLTSPGQVVTLEHGSHVTITITGVGPRPGATETGELWVGFAELGPVAQEWVHPPTTVLEGAPPGSPLAIVFHREWVRPTDRWRSDPEPRLARAFTLAEPLEAELSVTVRLAERAPDATIEALTGSTGSASSSRRLTGVSAARASAAFDDDPLTRWISAFNTALGTTISVPVDPDEEIETFGLRQGQGGLSRITQLKVTLGATTTAVDVPPADVNGVSTISIPSGHGELVEIEITGIEAATTVDRRYGETVVLPVAIAELTGLPTISSSVEVADCRDDLLAIDGEPVSIEIDVEALLAGEVVDATTCDRAGITLEEGNHTVESTNGLLTGINVDDLRLLGAGSTPDEAKPGTSVATVEVENSSATSASLTVGACPDGCWLIYGQGSNPGWEATIGGDGRGSPTPISGGFAGWWIPASAEPVHVEISFTPQRTLTAALVLSGMFVSLCLFLALRRRPAISEEPAAEVAAEAVAAELVVPWRRQGGRQRWWAAGALVAASGLFVAPIWVVPAAGVGVVLALLARPRLAGLGGLLGIAILAAVVVRRQVLYRYPASAAWPGTFEDLHRAGLFAVFLLGLVLFAGDSKGEPDPAPALTEPADAELRP